jgi:hypothetical protein
MAHLPARRQHAPVVAHPHAIRPAYPKRRRKESGGNPTAERWQAAGLEKSDDRQRDQHVIGHLAKPPDYRKFPGQKRTPIEAHNLLFCRGAPTTGGGSSTLNIFRTCASAEYSQ